ncbi:MAG: hypothetical protein K0U78_05070 [Actinomycetia bacterium]|nr:hypothetical protein [Actinomycetes bacterium]
MREIDYDKLRENLNSIINTMEHDGMRSPGKMKQNASELNAMYELKAKYAGMKKQTPTKKEG